MTAIPEKGTLMKHDVTAEAVKAAPPLAVSGAVLGGMHVNELIAWATLIYIVAQIAFLAFRWWRIANGEKDAE